MTPLPHRLRSLLTAVQIEIAALDSQTDDAPEACRLCGAELRVYERPERVCNHCLRAHQTTPSPVMENVLFENLAA